MREEGIGLAGDAGDGIGERRSIRDQLADALAQELRVEELLGVLPLVERLALVQPFVALQTKEPPARDVGQRLRQLGFAHARRSLDEHGAAHALGEKHHGGDAAVGDVPGVLEVLLDVLDGMEHLSSCQSELAWSVAHLRIAEARERAIAARLVPRDTGPWPTPQRLARIIAGNSGSGRSDS